MMCQVSISSLGVSSPICILELSRLTCIEKTVKNTAIFVIYKVLVYIQMSQPIHVSASSASDDGLTRRG